MQSLFDTREQGFVVIAEVNYPGACGADLGDVDVGARVAVEGGKGGAHVDVVLVVERKSVSCCVGRCVAGPEEGKESEDAKVVKGTREEGRSARGRGEGALVCDLQSRGRYLEL